MGFFKWDSSSEKPALNDNDLGEFVKVGDSGEGSLWEGKGEFLSSVVSLFISGTEDNLLEEQKQAMLHILRNQDVYESASNSALQEQYENADLEFINWKEHFSCLSISTTSETTEITFEERKSRYQFIVLFEGDQSTGVSIDS